MKTRPSLLDVLFWLTVVLIFCAQFSLCYEALVCRGHPPLSEIGIYKKWAAPCLIWIPAVFGSQVRRLQGLVVSSIGIAVLFAMIRANSQMRPSIGHLMGIKGIIEWYKYSIIFLTLVLAPMFFASLLYIERVFGDLWRSLWRLPNTTMSIEETWCRAWGFPYPSKSAKSADAMNERPS